MPGKRISFTSLNIYLFVIFVIRYTDINYLKFNMSGKRIRMIIIINTTNEIIKEVIVPNFLLVQKFLISSIFLVQTMTKIQYSLCSKIDKILITYPHKYTSLHFITKPRLVNSILTLHNAMQG